MSHIERFLVLAVAAALVVTVAPTTLANHGNAPIEVCPSGCDFSSIQDAVDHADAGDVILVRSATYDETVRIHTPDLEIRGEIGTEIRADSSIAANNHRPTVQIAADGVVFDGIDVTRIVDDPAAAGDGHTKAVGVNFDRSSSVARPANVTIQSSEISLVDETDQEDFGNALWVSDFNALGGTRADIDLDVSRVVASTNVDVNAAHGGFGGAAIGIFEAESELNVSVASSTLTDSTRAVHVAGGAPNVTITDSIVTGNGFGVLNDGGATVVAENNWWDSRLGPTHADNPFAVSGQTGDEVSDGVDYEPWCTHRLLVPGGGLPFVGCGPFPPFVESGAV